MGRGQIEQAGPRAPLATSTKESASPRGSAPPIPSEGEVGNSGVTRPGELQLPAGVGEPCPTTSSCSSFKASREMYFYLFPFVRRF